MAEEGIAVGRWVLDPGAIPVVDVASVSVVRERVREMAASIGMADVPAAALVNVASELAHNQLAHARGGYLAVGEARHRGERGLEVVAADAGPGIVDVARALEGRPSGGRSLGVGLAAALELADEVDFDVRVGEGMCVRARKFGRYEERGRRVGVYGRACPGETTSGDDAGFVRDEGGLLVGLADGLGHGPPAREASERAREVLVGSSSLSNEEILARCDAALVRTRGAVMAVARVGEAGGGELVVTSVGNVIAHVVGPGGGKRFGGSSFVLGAPGGVRRMVTERATIDPRGMLILASDGVSSRADLGADATLLREHPIVVAQRVVERHARDYDDATVLVVG